MTHDIDEPPPFLRSWRRVYAVVIVYLFALIGLFFWFGRAWSR
jgi:hypothetical protein